jgi:hypothetical protein
MYRKLWILVYHLLVLAVTHFFVILLTAKRDKFRAYLRRPVVRGTLSLTSVTLLKLTRVKKFGNFFNYKLA